MPIGSCACRTRSTARTWSTSDVELVGDVLDLGRQIALLVEAADQILGDGHVLVSGNDGAHVDQQLFGQRLL